MNLPYGARLASIAAASFFAVNLAAGAMSLALERMFRRRLQKCDPRRAAAAMLILRLAPGALALIAVAVLCVPSFLFLEPAGTSESASLVCLVMASLGIAVAAGAAVRSVAAWLRSRGRFPRWKGSRETLRLGARRMAVEIVDSRRPLLAMVGITRPRLVATRAVLRALKPAELDAALRHERAHAAFHDNWKRLLIAMTPDLVPFAVRFRSLETSWARFAERAADDRAVAGSARRSVALAAALVRVARLGAAAPAPLATSLMGDADDLESRVERLLRGPSPAGARYPRARLPWLWTFASVAATAAVCATYPVLLTTVHQLLERFMD
ncbi:MAG: M56 family metallopeptidase [Bryobacteraceae bacterium]